LRVTPPDGGPVSRLVQKLGRRYVGPFNARHRRTGMLWEGRYQPCLLDSDGYLLQCSRCIDLNPVRARTTDDPAASRGQRCITLRAP